MKIPRRFRKHIETVPGRCGGRPTIKNSRLTTQFLNELKEEAGWSEEYIASQYLRLTVEQVKAAIAFEKEKARESQE